MNKYYIFNFPIVDFIKLVERRTVIFTKKKKK